MKALEGVVKGSRTANTMRYMGNVLGGGGGLGASIAAGLGGTSGYMLGGSPGAMAGMLAPVAAGAGAKGTSNFLTRQGLRKADEFVRSRSPLAQKMVDEAPIKKLSPMKRAALVRALMLQQDEMRNPLGASR